MSELSPEEPTGEVPALRRAVRQTDGAWLGGVAQGISAHLGWPVLIVRLGFVGLAMGEYIGVIAYMLLWVMMPRAEVREAPGLESAERRGMRGKALATRNADLGALTALTALGCGVLWLARTAGMAPSTTWLVPTLVAGVGVALVWRQADETPQPVEPGTSRWLAPFVARGGRLAALRILLGTALVTLAVSLVAASQVGVAQLPLMLGLVLLMVLGLVIAAAPWLHQLRTGLQQAREEKLLADARADMAAHLHDSVLQTLALIQRQSSDPKAVASLARRQERELRTWLYGEPSSASTLRAALTDAVGEVEDDTGVPVEVVAVGDAELTAGLRALVKAAREAVMNAAKHSGADRIDVFLEVEDEVAEVFVRDRGRGFEWSDVGDDRMGLKESIIGRMERRGGTARVRPEPGEGTEVRLQMPTGGRA